MKKISLSLKKNAKKFGSMKKKQYFCAMKKIASIFFLLVSVAVIVASCNVTRTVTTTAEAVQTGDTAVKIVTQTIERYDATKKQDKTD